MKTIKSYGLELSIDILNQVDEQLKNLQLKNVEIFVDTFYNCRESGFVYTIYTPNSYESSLYIWTYQNRNSDNIVLLATTNPKHCDFNNLYTDEAYENCRRFFKYNERNKVVNEIVNLIHNICID